MIDAHWICVRLIERQQTEEGLDRGQEGDGRERLALEEPHAQVKEEGEQDLRSIFLAL